MNSKQSVYLLLPLVLLVWGIIGWRIWAAAGDPAVEAARGQLVPLHAKPMASHHRPELLLTYSDPFKPAATHSISPSTIALPRVTDGGNSVLSTLKRADASLNFVARSPVPVITASPVTWPQIKYLGLISHAGRNAEVALLAIDNQELVIKTGASERGVQVIKLLRDSVQLGFGGQKKSFARGLAN